MDNLGNLEEKVMLAVQTIRQLKDEQSKLVKQLSEKDAAAAALIREKEDLERKLDDFKRLSKENEILRTRQEEIRARVEQLINKLATLENEIAPTGQAELLSEDKH